MGAAKELGWAQLTELSERVSAVGGVAWLLTALLVLTAGLLLAVRARLRWAVMAAAAVLSQALILFPAHRCHR
jgi:hypothetical protein